MTEHVLVEQPTAGTPGQLRKILVMGDWVLDDHWVIGIHRSPTRSRTGQSHFRALHLPSSTVQSLCGAGRTASVLHQVKLRGEPFCSIAGIGLWHAEDTAALTAILDPRRSIGQTPHRLTLKPVAPEATGASDPPGSTGMGGRPEILFNLCSLLDEEAQKKCGTTRMIRIYQHTGATVTLLQRIDWEIPILDLTNHGDGREAAAGGTQRDGERESVWIPMDGSLAGSNLEQFITAHKPFAAVVIKDMRKRVVSEALIRFLAKSVSGVPWFVSSKAWCPTWFDALPKSQVRLLLVPQIAAQLAIRSGAVNRWITRPGGASRGALSGEGATGTLDGEASRGALEELDKLGRRFSEAIVVALPEGLSILARQRSTDDEKRIGIIQTDEGPKPLGATMPMASVFFPALIAELLRTSDPPLEPLLKRALRFTHRWMSYEFHRVESPEEWSPSLEQVLDLEGHGVEIPSSSEVKAFDGNWQEFPWNRAIADWEAAFKDYGVIEPEPPSSGADPTQAKRRRRLELRRAMTEVDGYVCCIDSKRQILQRIVNELKSFEARGKTDHISCMLIAGPGSGKTFLARRLAEAVGLRFLGFNITQMISKSDLLDCFDTIVTNQAQNREEPLLVFVDEINARLDGQHVYDTFLAPLEEHVYVRAGKTFHIDPCVWVFAGTERPSSQKGKRRDRSEKAGDFESRLTLEPLDLGVGNRSEDNVEKVYLGVSLLRGAFPDVRRVSKKVLEAFYNLPPNLEAREIKHFVESFVDIQYGEVRTRNLVLGRLQSLCGNIKGWKDEPENQSDMVEIVG
jgi:hypothetical protein